jgi:hypothetical protein
VTFDVIPEIVRRLITDRIDSIPELETILLLRQYRTQTWNAIDTGKRLYVSSTVAVHMLDALTDRGFFARSADGYTYAPESPQLEAAVDALADAYTQHLFAVTTFVHAKPSMSVRLFAEAFRIRKDK